MQINLTITVKGIKCQTHTAAKQMAFDHIMGKAAYMLVAVGIDALDPGVSSPEGTFVPAEDQFAAMARSYREADGTFTVTIP